MKALIASWKGPQDRHGASLDRAAPLPRSILQPKGLEKIQDGADERNIAKDVTVAPWRPLVCLQIYDGDAVGIGSGVLISPTVVLTAAHNLHLLSPTRGQGRWPKAITAHVGVVNNDKGAAMSRVVRVETCPGYRESSAGMETQFDFDFGIARLADEALFNWAKTCFDVPAQKPLREDEISQHMLTAAGYPHEAGKPVRLHFHAGRMVTSCAPLTFRYKLDTAAGQSGGPVFRFHGEDKPCHLAGVHVGGDASSNKARRYDASMQQQVVAWLAASGGQLIG
jgi:V8-like Glu-specific endopeptidase